MSVFKFVSLWIGALLILGVLVAIACALFWVLCSLHPCIGYILLVAPYTIMLIGFVGAWAWHITKETT